MHARSLEIVSNQTGIHDQLENIVKKHFETSFQKPISSHTQEAYDRLNHHVKRTGKPVVLDSCCGVGQSTRVIAEIHPEALVIGLDKSACRLGKHQQDNAPTYYLERVDLNDFWRLVVDAKWPVIKHYLLFPNPWPKSKHIQRRWHGSPVFPALLQIGGSLELRSNWKLYLEEFQAAAKIAGFESDLYAYVPDRTITPFERKYKESSHALWALTLDLSKD